MATFRSSLVSLKKLSVGLPDSFVETGWYCVSDHFLYLVCSTDSHEYPVYTFLLCYFLEAHGADLEVSAVLAFLALR